MADIELDSKEQSLFNEVGSRGDAFREAVRDEAAAQVDETGQMSEITGSGEMLDAVMAPDSPPPAAADTFAATVPPDDLESVSGPAPGTDQDRPATASG